MLAADSPTRASRSIQQFKPEAERRRYYHDEDVVGPIIRRVKTMSTCSWHTHTMGLLQMAVRRSPACRQFVVGTCVEHGGRVNVIVYSDKQSHARKCVGKRSQHSKKVCTYVSLLASGYPALSFEMAWFTSCRVRNQTVKHNRESTNRQFKLTLGFSS